MPNQDPLVSAFFSLEFQQQIVGAFLQCSGMESQNEVVEYKASGPKGEYIIRKVPGRIKWNNITLKRGITDSMDMWKWRKLVEQGKVDEARKNGSIVMFDQQGKEVARWNLINVWPNKISESTADATKNEIAVEELELAIEGLERVK